jgi:hypothetical protein
MPTTTETDPPFAGPPGNPLIMAPFFHKNKSNATYPSYEMPPS